MTPRGAERPDDDADLRDEQAGRSRRRFSRGRPDSADFADVPEEETGWLDDLRTAKQARGAIGPGEAEPEPGHGRRSIDRGNPAPSSGAPMRPSSGAPVRPSSGIPGLPSVPGRPSPGVPGRPSSGVPGQPSSGAPGQPSPGVAGRASAAPQPRGRHTSDEFPTIGRHGSGEEPVPGRRRAPEDTPTGRRAAPDEPATGRHGTGENPTPGRRRAPEDGPTGRRAAAEDGPTGRRAVPEDAPTGRRTAAEDASTGRRAALVDGTTGRRAAGEDGPTGRRAAPEDGPTGRRAAPDDVATGRRGGSESTGRHGQVNGDPSPTRSRRSRAAEHTSDSRTGEGDFERRSAERPDREPSGGPGPVSPVPGIGGTGFGSRNVNPGRARREVAPGQARPDAASGQARPGAASGQAPPDAAPGQARPDAGWRTDAGRQGASAPGPRAAAPAGPGRAPVPGRTSRDTGTGAIPPVVPGPAGVRSPAVPGRAGAMADSPSGVVRRPESHDGHDGHAGHPPSGVEHPADAAASVIHPGAALGSVSPEQVRQGPRSPRDTDRPGAGSATGRVSATASARVGTPPAGRVSAAASVAGIVAAPRPETAAPPPGTGAPQSPAVGIPPARPGDGPVRPATGAARVTAAASVPATAAGTGSIPGTASVHGTGSIPGAASVFGTGSIPGTASVLGTGSFAGAAAVAPALAGEYDGRPSGLRQQMRSERRLRVVALLTLAGVVLLALPLIFGILSVVRDPVFHSLDALNVPSWAAQHVDDRGSGSRWCFMDCRFRERTAQSQQPFAQTNRAYAAALHTAGWQPWKVSGCPDQPIAASDGVYTCWRRDEFTLDLWVKPPDCAVDKIAQQDPALLPSNPANGAAPKPAKCTGSTVSIKVQNAITDQRGTPDGEQPGLTGETPDPVLSNDPLLEPSTSPS